MKGKIKSYLEEKKYGFIESESGDDYFFHFNDLNNSSKKESIKKGVKVVFDPELNAKGYYAKDIQIQKTILKEVAVPYFESKNPNPKIGKVIKREEIQTEFFKDINQAKNQVQNIANEVGANAVLNKRLVKETFSQGNYQYTVNSFKFDLCIVVDTLSAYSQYESEQSQIEIESLKDRFDTKYYSVKKSCDEKIEKQISSQKGGGTILFLFAFITFFLIFQILLWV